MKRINCTQPVCTAFGVAFADDAFVSVMYSLLFFKIFIYTSFNVNSTSKCKTTTFIRNLQEKENKNVIILGVFLFLA